MIQSVSFTRLEAQCESYGRDTHHAATRLARDGQMPKIAQHGNGPFYIRPAGHCSGGSSTYRWVITATWDLSGARATQCSCISASTVSGCRLRRAMLAAYRLRPPTHTCAPGPGAGPRLTAYITSPSDASSSSTNPNNHNAHPTHTVSTTTHLTLYGPIPFTTTHTYNHGPV
jgi:hypothetical protein